MIFNQVIRGSGGSQYAVEKIVSNGTLLNQSPNFIDLTGVTNIGTRALAYAYTGDAALTGKISIPSLTQITGIEACYNTFQNTMYITEFEMPNVTTISGTSSCREMFASSVGLTKLDLSGLVSITGQNACDSMCFLCTFLTEIKLDSLTTISGRSACTSMLGNSGITSLSFPSLSVLTGQNAMKEMCYNCTSLTSISFPALTSTSFGSYTNQFNDMLAGCTGVVVHFPSNLQSVIGSWADVTAGFGGTNTTVSFDLTATE